MIDNYDENGQSDQIDWDCEVEKAETRLDSDFAFGLCLAIFATVGGYCPPLFYFHWLPLNQIGYRIVTGWTIMWITICLSVAFVIKRLGHK